MTAHEQPAHETTAHDVIRRLDYRGVSLRLEDGRIKFRSAHGDVAPELLAEMKAHRDALRNLLAARTESPWPPAPSGDSGELTWGQRGLWASGQLADEPGVHHICGAVRLRGPLDVAALESALDGARAAHPSLRTVFPAAHGTPRQEVLPHTARPLAVEDVTADDRPRRCAELAAAPFALDTEPPLRVALLRSAPDDHVLFFAVHHLIADGESVRVLVDDLAHRYNGRTPPVGRFGMVDYAAWQHARVRDADHGAARRFWRDRLADPGAGLLPLPRPATGQGGGAHTVRVDAPTTAALRTLAQECRARPFTVLSAAVSVLLAQVADRRELVVGTPVAQRDRAGLDTLIGHLVAMVPVRVDLTGRPAFRDLVARVRSAVLAAVDHAGLPVEVVRDELGVRPVTRDGGLFNVVVTDVGPAVPAPRFDGLQTTLLDVDHNSAKYDLNFLVQDDGDTLSVTVEFHRRAVADADAAALAGLLGTIVRLVVADPDLPLAELPLGDGHAWGVGAAPARVPAAADSLAARLARTAAERGDADALRHMGDTLSYRALDARTDAVARGLRARGVRAGDVVAVPLPRGSDLVVAMLGVVRAGAAYLVLDEAWPQARTDAVTTDAGARLRIDADTLRALADEGADAPPCPPVPLDAVAYVIYTSGSTGRPKGVHVTHRNVLSLLDGTGPEFGFGPHDTWTLFHSCAFDFSVWEVFGSLTTGGTLVVVPPWVTREPEAFARLLERERVTVLNLTPSAFSVLLPVAAEHPGRVRDVRLVIFGGEAFDQGLAPRWYEIADGELVNMYGITETTVHASWQRIAPGRAPAWRDGGIGGPLPGGALYLLDRDGRPCADRCAGEIHVGGPGVSNGYPGLPRLTAERFVPDPFSPVPGARMYRSGDLGRRRGSALHYLGRRDGQVQLHGFRIELAEVEKALAAQPGVAAAGCAVADGRLVAAVTAADGRQPQAADVRREARLALPRHMVPATVSVVDALPLTANGKLDRAAIAALRPAPSRRDAVAPAGPAEEALAEAYREALDVDTVSTADDFFERGGDSMRAIRLVALARERGIHLSVRDVYTTPVLAELAAAGGAPREQVPARTAPFGLLPERAAKAFGDSVEDAYPMTALQTGMVYHSELEPAAAQYHIMLSYTLRAPMDRALFQEALETVVGAHAVLRTGFDLGHRTAPMQVVHRTVAPPLRYENVEHLDAAGQAAHLAKLLRDESSDPIDLTAAPLYRFVVVEFSPDSFQLVFTHHHAILDGWSVNLLFEELASRYLDLLEGRPARPVAVLRSAFADYVALERQACDDPAIQRYWRERTTPESTGLAAERTGPPDMRHLPVPLPHGVVDDLHTVAAEVAVPLKSLLLAVHMRVLAWLSGHRSVVTGLTTACRPEQPDADRVLGLFLNNLPLRTTVGGQTWAELAHDVHAAELELMRHRWYPHAAIQQSYGSRPLVDTGFNFTDFHVTHDLVRSGRLEITGITEQESTHYAFGADFTVDMRTAQLRLSLEHDASVVPAATMDLAVRAYRSALLALLARPHSSCRAASLLGADEESRLVARGRGARTPATGATVPALFADRVRENPAKHAVETADRTWTYRELALRTESFAQRLTALGVGAGDTVGVLLHANEDQVAAFLATQHIGAVYVPLNPDDGRLHHAHVLDGASVRAVVSADRFRDALAWLAGHGTPLLVAEDVPDEPSEAVPVTALPARAPAYIVYTSGSTGNRKGVVVGQDALVNRLQWGRGHFRAAEVDRTLMTRSTGFDAAIIEMLEAIVAGGTLVALPDNGGRDADLVAAAVRAHRITCLHVAPSLLHALLDSPTCAADLATLRLIQCAGDVLPRALANRFLETCPVRLVNIYGLTETAIDATACDVAPGGRGDVPIGRPVGNVDLFVLDADLNPVPDGVAGDLYIGGACVAHGYGGEPGLTARRFVPDPWSDSPGGRLHWTGDRARRDADGNIAFLGRLDGQLSIGGVRVDPSEIESHARLHAKVAEAAAVERRHADGTATLVLFVLPAEGAELDGREIRDHLRPRLPRSALPHRCVVLDAFPVTADGKTDRRALARLRTADQESAAAVAPRTPLEQAVADVWTQVLGPGPFGVEDDFFEVGGSSLTAVRVVNRLRAQHGSTLPLGEFMDAPTVAATARALAQAPGATPAGAPPPAPAGAPAGAEELPLSQAQHQMWLLESKLPGLPLFGMPGAVEMQGPLDVPALERTFAELVRRHDALRTRVRVDGDGRPVLRAEPEVPFALAHVDLREHPHPDARCERLIAKAVRAPFDLAVAPLLRATVYRLADDRHVLLLNVHHLVCDGWSLAVLFDEAGRIYRSLTADEGLPELPAAPGSGRLARERESRLLGEEAARQRAYWLETLAAPWARLGGKGTSRLARFGEGGVKERLRSASCRLRVAPADTARLARAAALHGTTEFVLALSAYAATLRAWSDQDDIRIATMLANRMGRAVEDAVGLFVNTAVLRLHVEENASPAELAAQSRRVCVAAQQHQELPFEEVLDALDAAYPDRMRVDPLFEAMFVMQEEYREADEVGGLRMSPYRPDSDLFSGAISATTCDLVLNAVPQDGELVLELRYKPATLGRAQARRLLDDIGAALSATAESLLQEAR
ncbi:amino acid adenylation domain-containing protein [Streptomyces sp. NPDC004111]|uniref:amino acid adenylation domain-containing protein n=1 Tax=Streptomyces sp. NPDC004111 TaxID=3364690 RepID=UPI0036B842EE